MKIEDMRIGAYYLFNGKAVECVCLARETHGTDEPKAAHRLPSDVFSWHPCSVYKPIGAAHFIDDIREKYAHRYVADTPAEAPTTAETGPHKYVDFFAHASGGAPAETPTPAPLKVGDRVRVVSMHVRESYGWPSHDVAIGSTGVIIKQHYDEEFPELAWCVAMRSPEGFERYFAAEELERVAD